MAKDDIKNNNHSKCHILAFDTSRSALSIYLLKLDKAANIISHKNIYKNLQSLQIQEKNTGFYDNTSSNQSQYLIVKIAEILQKNDISYHNLLQIATSKGPGSFTGIRIGLSCLKAIAFASNYKIPITSFNSLEIMANKYFIDNFPKMLQNETKEVILITTIKSTLYEFFTAEFLLQASICQITQISTIKILKRDKIRQDFANKTLDNARNIYLCGDINDDINNDSNTAYAIAFMALNQLNGLNKQNIMSSNDCNTPFYGQEARITKRK